MMESIAALPKDIQDLIEYREWSIKTKEGICKFTEMKGKVLPTICIEGELVFPSRIPQYEELIEAMAARAKDPETAQRIRDLKDVGFQFDHVEDNLRKAGAGQNTREQ